MVCSLFRGHKHPAYISVCALVAIAASRTPAFAAGPSQVQANPALLAKPALAISLDGSPGYTFTGKCGSSDQYVIVHLHIANAGSAPSPAIDDRHAVSVAEQNTASWSGGTALPAIDPGKSATIALGIPARTPASAMDGSHTFVVTVNRKPWFAESSTANHTLLITVTGGPHCALASALNPGVVNAVGPPPPKQLALPPKSIILQGPSIAAPAKFWYTNDPTVCVNHAGLLATLVCPALLADGTTLLLVWDWNPYPCPSGNCITSIDGFHIYRVSQGAANGQYIVLPSRTLVDTQSDPRYTLRGIKPFSTGQCFVATAFKGKTESPDSWTYCVPANLALGTQEKTYWPDAGQTRAAFNVGCAHPNTFDAKYTILGGPEAGTQAFTNGQDGCQGNENFQGIFAFDLSYRHKAQRALLNVQSINGSNCATAVALTDVYWPTLNPVNFEATHFVGVNPSPQWQLPAPQNGVMTLDLSSYYNSWVGNKIGFAFISPAPDWGQYQGPSCLSNYSVTFDVIEYK